MEAVYVCALVACCGALSAAFCSTSAGKRLGELLKLDGKHEWEK